MRLYEFEGCKLFQNEGIPVPKYALATSPQEAKVKAGEIGLPVVIKAQVLSGGRWLAGGVQNAANPEEAEKVARPHIGKTYAWFQGAAGNGEPENRYCQRVLSRCERR